MNNNDENQVVINNKQKKKPKWYVILICIILLFGFMAVVAMSVVTIAKNNSSCDKLLDEATYVNGHSQTNISSEKNHVDGLNVEYTILKGYHDGYTIARLDNTFVRTYKEFKNYIKWFGKVTVDDINAQEYDINVLEYFDREYFKNHTLAIIVYDSQSSGIHYNFETVTKNENQVNININRISQTGGALPKYITFEFIELDKNVEHVNFNITVVKNYSSNSNQFPDWGNLDIYKPIIYLYPTEETHVNVQLGNEEALTHVYPAYNGGWNVLAKPNGDLTDLATGRYQYGLYYESVCPVPYTMTDTGFVVKGEDTIIFLEEKLEILGLTEREADEFIIYWLPILEKHEYNYIRFATQEEINANMPLSIQPKPDNIIRVIMVFKELDAPIDIQEQVLTTPERTGFTVVEWGGTQLQ